MKCKICEKILGTDYNPEPMPIEKRFGICWDCIRQIYDAMKFEIDNG